jgi:hypothetical protein
LVLFGFVWIYFGEFFARWLNPGRDADRDAEACA